MDSYQYVNLKYNKKLWESNKDMFVCLLLIYAYYKASSYSLIKTVFKIATFRQHILATC